MSPWTANYCGDRNLILMTTQQKTRMNAAMQRTIRSTLSQRSPDDDYSTFSWQPRNLTGLHDQALLHHEPYLDTPLLEFKLLG
jgi:hypothetical protein